MRATPLLQEEHAENNTTNKNAHTGTAEACTAASQLSVVATQREVPADCVCTGRREGELASTTAVVM